MKKNYHIIFLASAIFLYENAFCHIAYSKANGILNDALNEYNMSMEVGGSLPVTRNFKYPSKGKIFRTIIAEEKGIRIEIETIKPLKESESKKYSKSKYIIVRSLFEPQATPYSGELTFTTSCPEDKKPIELNKDIIGKSETVLVVNATERFVLGACEDQIIQKRAGFVVFFDKTNQTLYQITIFQPLDSFNQDEVIKMLQSFKRD